MISVSVKDNEELYRQMNERSDWFRHVLLKAKLKEGSEELDARDLRMRSALKIGDQYFGIEQKPSVLDYIADIDIELKSNGDEYKLSATIESEPVFFERDIHKLKETAEFKGKPVSGFYLSGSFVNSSPFYLINGSRPYRVTVQQKAEAKHGLAALFSKNKDSLEQVVNKEKVSYDMSRFADALGTAISYVQDNVRKTGAEMPVADLSVSLYSEEIY